MINQDKAKLMLANILAFVALLGILFIVLFLTTRNCHAADLSTNVSRVALYGGHAADLISTRYALASGHAHETSIVGDRLGPQLTITILSAAGMDLLATAAARDGHPRLAKIFRWSFGGVHLAATWNNINVGVSSRRKYQ